MLCYVKASGDGPQGSEQGHERPGEQHEAGPEVQQHHGRGRLQKVGYHISNKSILILFLFRKIAAQFEKNQPPIEL